MSIPFLRPIPRRLSGLVTEFRVIKQLEFETNNDATTVRFEAALEEEKFKGTGTCMTVRNATIGPMIAIRALVERADVVRRIASRCGMAAAMHGCRPSRLPQRRRPRTGSV